VPARKAAGRRSLDQIAVTFPLDTAGLAEVLRVSVAELERWQRTGAPATRERELDDLLVVADTLTRKLAPGLAPRIVRRPAAAYEGRSLLALLTAGEHQRAREAVVHSFDWAATA
jgi:hypothetical protein